MDFLLRLEQSGLATWVREGGSIWSYPTILFAHTLGLATLAGVSASIDLRILGFATQIPLAPLRRLYPLMWTAFGVTAASGIALLLADASTRLTSPVFYVKMVFVALAVVTLELLKKQAFRPAAGEGPVAGSVKAMAAASIFFWLAATTAGRLMAYIGPAGGFE